MIDVNIPLKDLFIKRCIVKNHSIPNEQVLVQKGPIINDGVDITMENGGEFLII